MHNLIIDHVCLFLTFCFLRSSGRPNLLVNFKPMMSLTLGKLIFIPCKNRTGIMRPWCQWICCPCAPIYVDDFQYLCCRQVLSSHSVFAGVINTIVINNLIHDIFNYSKQLQDKQFPLTYVVSIKTQDCKQWRQDSLRFDEAHVLSSECIPPFSLGNSFPGESCLRWKEEAAGC